MLFNIEAIIYYLVLLDSVIINVIAFSGSKIYERKFKGFSKRLPLTKGWSILYFVLVLWVGFGLFRLGILPY